MSSCDLLVLPVKPAEKVHNLLTSPLTFLQDQAAGARRSWKVVEGRCARALNIWMFAEQLRFFLLVSSTEP